LAAIGRTHRRLERWIDPLTIVMVALPGPIVGLAVVSLFQANVPGFRSLYQQTLVPTMLALLVRGVPVAYWILRAGYRGIDTSVLEASRLDGSWLRRVWSIDRRMLQGSLLAALLAAAVVASGDVPATLPVIPPGVTTVGTRLFGLLHSGARYQEAALAIWYVLAVVTISLVLIRQGLASRVRV
jgi:iron(III) transport system permease protein